MEPLNKLTKESILEEEVFTELFDQEDEIYKAKLMISLEERAQELGVKSKFTKLLNAYKRVERESRKSRSRVSSLIENWTNFIGPYGRMKCKSWIASEDGVMLYNPNTGITDIVACYHPILPVERMKNLETGEERIKLAYKRNNQWNEIIVPKTVVTSASKIVALSGRGISVTSENAKFLVRYLADVENANDDAIHVQYSSAKLGWIRGGFLPYDTEIVFDGDTRYGQIYDSIQQVGSRNRWFEYVSGLRKTKRLEIKLMLAASFASVLVQPLSGLPFFVDLWGETEGGKSVTLAVAASVWACPEENAYIKDYKGTDVGLEVICDLLNHLPLILDDSSKKNRKLEENFEGLVYDLCSGKGKTRSNKELSINRENHWKNCILTNGERPLSSYVTQGGAINRILELECGAKVYDDPGAVMELICKNYGYAGKEFVDLIKDLGISKIREIQKMFLEELADDEKMQKQSLSMSIILTADKLATEYLFKDGQYISLEEAKEILTDRNEISDNERCYEYLMDKISMNPARFENTVETLEKWGIISDGYAIIFPAAFTELCKGGGFSKTAFLSWAERKGFLQADSGRKTKIKKIAGRSIRCVFLKMNGGEEKLEDHEFHSVSTYEQEELPFD
ncbi:DUF927 domain-containing protein [Clostridiaceae bacterium Marseille-Q4145]|nr:DUF927 domain-containing protein [Clostridiaceae bacterium Marseille-Q4145]